MTKSDKKKSYHKNTLTIHGSSNPDNEYKSIAPPIYQTSSFRFEHAQQGADRFAGKEPGYIYTRLGNPTCAAFEDWIATMEHGHAALATSTGMAAVTTVFFALLNQGDHMVGTDSVYTASRLIIEQDFARFGVTSDFVDTSEIENLKKAVNEKTRLILIETPANPNMKLTDISQAAKIAKECGALLVVDNTFMSPVLQNPLELGADIVVHSVTKFINGHTDLVGGAVVAKDPDVFQQLQTALFHFGGTMDPHQAWLVLRGTKTLSMRIEAAQKNAMILAERLQSHPKIQTVMYPGLKTHPQHELAKSQARGFGSLISFELKDGIEAGKTMLNNVQLCLLAVSLGGIETLIQHPASMTHASIPEKDRIDAGITDGLVRLSVGCEHVEDLWEDLSQALDTI